MRASFWELTGFLCAFTVSTEYELERRTNCIGSLGEHFVYMGMERVCCFSKPRTRFASSVLRTILFAVLMSSVYARGLLESKGIQYARVDGQFDNVKNHERVASQETTRQMLNVLGMDELPKPRHGIIPHQYMIQIYEKMSRRKPDRNGVNTIRGFVDVGK